jgi:hypothetical protein
MKKWPILANILSVIWPTLAKWELYSAESSYVFTFFLYSIYGTIKKTPKYKLSKYFEYLITHKEPSTIDTVLYDTMFQSLLADLHLTFGNVAALVLTIICSVQATEVYFVCDSCVKSIKNVEQLTRGVNDG